MRNINGSEIGELIIKSAQMYEKTWDDEGEMYDDVGELISDGGDLVLVNTVRLFLDEVDPTGFIGSHYLPNLYFFENKEIKIRQDVLEKLEKIKEAKADGYTGLLKIMLGLVKRNVKCLRCGNVWTPRTNKPSVCPYCGSKKWDSKRKGNEPGRMPGKKYLNY